MFVHDLNAAARYLTTKLSEGEQWIAIDGLGASGKSELARLTHQANPQIAVVALDDFTRPGSVNWDGDRFLQQVRYPLDAGQDAHYQRWHWTSDQPGEWVTIPAGTPVLVEGIGASTPPGQTYWDLTVWMEAPPQTRMARAERRAPERFACWSATWRPIEDAWFENALPWKLSDLIVINA